MSTTVRRLNKALSEDELFSIMELNMADTANLLSILSEIEIRSSWNMFDKREAKDIISSLVNMLCSHQVYDKDGLEISKW